MRKLFALIACVLVFSSCDFITNKYNQYFKEEPPQPIDTIIIDEDVDVMALTLEALRKKRIPSGYQIVGDVQSDVLTYLGFMVDDVKQYIFKNANGEKIVFSDNDTNFALKIKSKKSPRKNGGFEANPRYVNKEFRVVWRKLILTRDPQNEIEFYNHEIEQIIFLQEQTQFLIKEFE
ncbi:MAG TPA: hypothetical protein GXZ87_01135 [Bacteroidales bacterium]|nr:hypothetical protein [Bacteroidales bacterium]